MNVHQAIPEVYHKKIIQSGRVVEVYEYCSKPMTRGDSSKPKETVSTKPKKEPTDADKYLSAEQSLSRTRKTVRRLINANEMHLDKFLTLTFAENLTDVKEANYKFMKFIQRLKYRYRDLQYVTVIEFQKRGAVHYHMLCNLPFIDKEYLATVWKHGFIKINQIEHVDNVGAYVCKYMSKGGRDTRLEGKKMYFTSRNLNKPIEWVNIDEVRAVEGVLADIDPKYSDYFENDYVGVVHYSQYKL